MRPDDELLASRALSALADQCEIPAEVEERILSAVLDDAPPPVVPSPRAEPAPFENVVRLSRQEQRFWRRIGWTAAAAAVALFALIVVHRLSGSSHVAPTAFSRSPGYAPPAAAMSGRRAPEGHPRLEEARTVMFRVMDTVTAECNVAWWSADVLFEKTGHATVLGVSSSGAAERACVGRAVSGARARLRPGPRLAIRYEVDARGAGGRADVRRISGWIVDES